MNSKQFQVVGGDTKPCKTCGVQTIGMSKEQKEFHKNGGCRRPARAGNAPPRPRQVLPAHQPARGHQNRVRNGGMATFNRARVGRSAVIPFAFGTSQVSGSGALVDQVGDSGALGDQIGGSGATGNQVGVSDATGDLVGVSAEEGSLVAVSAEEGSLIGVSAEEGSLVGVSAEEGSLIGVSAEEGSLVGGSAD